MDEEMDQSWQQLSEQILTDIKEWRQAHPKATFREIEDEVHARMSRVARAGAARCSPSKPQSRLEWRKSNRSDRSVRGVAPPCTPAGSGRAAYKQREGKT